MKLPSLGKITAPALVAGALLLALPATALAQAYPGGPGYGNQGHYGGGYQRAGTQISGVVTYFNRFDLRVRSGGRDLYVQLHQGTVINPTGITLRPGMAVSVAGFIGRNGTLHANRIDVQRGRGGWRR